MFPALRGSGSLACTRSFAEWLAFVASARAAQGAPVSRQLLEDLEFAATAARIVYGGQRG
jgi:hypothetical protein